MHQRHGKQDTYYVIPGGAPVIFEDDQGNELTRLVSIYGFVLHLYSSCRIVESVILVDGTDHIGSAPSLLRTTRDERSGGTRTIYFSVIFAAYLSAWRRLGFDDESSLDYEHRRQYGSESGYSDRGRDYPRRRHYG